MLGSDTGELSAVIMQQATQRVRGTPKNSLEFDPLVHAWRDMLILAQDAYFKALLIATNDKRDPAIKLSGLSKAQFYQKLKEIKQFKEAGAAAQSIEDTSLLTD